MPDYGGPSGFGGSGGGEAATGGMGPGQGSGYGGNQSGQHHGGMSQATKDALKKRLDLINKKQDEPQDNCYNGVFWDFKTEKFLRWNELNKKERK